MHTLKAAQYSVIVWAAIVVSVALIFLISHDNAEFAVAMAGAQTFVGLAGTGTMVVVGLLGDFLSVKLA